SHEERKEHEKHEAEKEGRPSPSSLVRVPAERADHSSLPLSSSLITHHSSLLLHRVLHWTGGHPYLTQRLCQAVALDESAGVEAVDGHCQALFLSPRAQERDDNLLFVRERLLKSERDTAGLLHLYAQVWQGQRVPDDEMDPFVGVLRLAGIVRAVSG